MEPSKRSECTQEDKLLMIYLLGKIPAHQLNAIDLMKWVFLIKTEAYKQQKGIFFSHFHMWDNGPISTPIYGCREELTISSICTLENFPRYTKPTETITLKPDSYALLDWIDSLSYEIPWVFNFIDEIYDQYKDNFNLWHERQGLIYELEVNGKKVRDYIHGEDFNLPLDEDWQIFHLSQNEQEDFAKLLTDEGYQKFFEEYENLAFKLSTQS